MLFGGLLESCCHVISSPSICVTYLFSVLYCDWLATHIILIDLDISSYVARQCKHMHAANCWKPLRTVSCYYAIKYVFTEFPL